MQKKLGVFFISFALVSIFTSDTLAGVYNQIGFSFTVKSNQGNTRSDPRARDTKDRNVTWYVNMTHSGEGWGTITQYWLENKNGTNVSPHINVHAGFGEYYQVAYDNARTNVYLTAQNNNYNAKTYAVRGYWDEETPWVMQQIKH